MSHKLEYIFKGERVKFKISVAKLELIVFDNELSKNNTKKITENTLLFQIGVPIPDLSSFKLIHSFSQISVNFKHI